MHPNSLLPLIQSAGMLYRMALVNSLCLVSTLTTATLRRAMHGIREEESADGNDDVNHDAETPLQVVGLAITKEGTNYEYSENEGDSVEDSKVVVHVWNTQTPADQHDQRSVEQCSLNGCTHNVGHGHVDLVVVGFIDSKEVL